MFPAQHKAGVHHDIIRSREEATGTPKARHIGVVPSIISIDGASIIVIALSVLGGRDGGPATDAHALAGTLGGSLGAALAGSLAGLETLLRDVAADLEALWESPGIGRGRGRRDTVGPLGSFAVVAGEDRGVADRCAVECRCSPRSLAAASDPGVRRAGAGRPAAGESRATAVASFGRGASGAPGARQGGGCADGVCLVGEHG